ncbi:MAG: 50S ribosomal protein L20 [Candidatus Harrisonbacteria bacterium RIFCSPLOWO2_02_FULL_45_10c]|uniref:Large ribosomal subunit protein bL20 n=1 Tax=Candidatus Harrisonbacteria bacterium RIFCSPLOWO2_02_FULL_45_10c TaxID=1798410 RepID=A0A1G1ZUE8_9BACT|nr:MAG: 50S ribosomal protein L20 [Candidatus Harrisonbacteria bacterium RIFCSPLOWO2_02_FULL_45_10c]
MSRVKRGTTATRRRHKVLKYTKGFRWGRKSKERAAKEALLHAWVHAFRGRKEKKRNYRRLWNVRINAAVRAHGINYSQAIHKLSVAKIKLDRKILSELAQHEPKVFDKIITAIK